jgi:hypothetical protein
MSSINHHLKYAVSDLNAVNYGYGKPDQNVEHLTKALENVSKALAQAIQEANEAKKVPA